MCLDACKALQARRSADGIPFVFQTELPFICSAPDRSKPHIFAKLETLVRRQMDVDEFIRQTGEATSNACFSNYPNLMRLDSIAAMGDVFSATDRRLEQYTERPFLVPFAQQAVARSLVTLTNASTKIPTGRLDAEVRVTGDRSQWDRPEELRDDDKGTLNGKRTKA